MSSRGAHTAEWEMAFERLAGEMRIGFGQVVSAVQQTNEQLVQTNLRLDQTNEQLVQSNLRLDQTILRLDQTNLRLDQTNLRLDQTNEHLQEFKLSVNSKLDGIGSYLKLIDRNFVGVEMRLTKIEHRVDRLEDVG